MAEFSSLIGRMPKPIDQDICDLMLMTTDAVLTFRYSEMAVIADAFKRRYELAVDAMRQLATSEEDQRALDNYLDNKRRTIATWLSNCHRCHIYVCRSLVAELQEDDQVANPYESYWHGSLDELHKML